MSFTRKRKIAPLIVVLVFVFGMIIGTGMVRYSQAANETYDNLKTFSEVLSIIQKNYVEEVKPKDTDLRGHKGHGGRPRPAQLLYDAGGIQGDAG